jgi:hypothetical protein
MTTTRATIGFTEEGSDYDPLIVTVEVNREVPDQWFKDLQDHIASALPPAVTWTVVHKQDLHVQDPTREVAPNP